MIINGYIKKPFFYSLLEQKMKELGISEDDYPVDSIKIANSYKHNLRIEYMNFSVTGFGGIMYKGVHKSNMALNTLRTKEGQNFDCMHELIHYWFHPPGDNLCFDIEFIKKNPIREWQANQGAAEILVPRKLFTRKYIESRGDLGWLSEYFFVSKTVIEYRVKNLSLDKINFKTLRTCGRKDAVHCAVCGSTDVSHSDNYCKICGSPRFFAKDTRWVKYGEGAALDKFGHAAECPVCGAGEIAPHQKNCPSCGACLVQKCTDNNEKDDGIDERGCGDVLDGSSRYCRTCGHKSTFYRNRYLKDWQDEMGEILKGD